MRNRLFQLELEKKYYVIFLTIGFMFVSYFLINATNNVSTYTMAYTFVTSKNSEEDKSVMSEALNKADYASFLEKRIAVYQKANQSYPNILIKNAIAFDTYLLEKKIQPLNIVGNAGLNNITKVNGVSSIYMTIKTIIPLMLPLLALLFILNSLRDTKKAYNYIMTLPMKKSDIMKTKWFSSIVMTFVGICLLMVSSFIIGISFGGVGDFTYPVILQATSLEMMSVTAYIPLWLFLLLSMGIILIQIIAYVSLGMLLCKLIKNTWAQFLIAFLGITIIWVYFMRLPVYIDDSISLIPFVSDPYHIITQGYNMFSLTLYFFILIVISGLTYGLYLSRNTKKVYFNETR